VYQCVVFFVGKVAPFTKPCDVPLQRSHCREGHCRGDIVEEDIVEKDVLEGEIVEENIVEGCCFGGSRRNLH
jgi:hypothetical protein